MLLSHAKILLDACMIKTLAVEALVR